MFVEFAFGALEALCLLVEFCSEGLNVALEAFLAYSGALALVVGVAFHDGKLLEEMPNLHGKNVVGVGRRDRGKHLGRMEWWLRLSRCGEGRLWCRASA